MAAAALTAKRAMDEPAAEQKKFFAPVLTASGMKRFVLRWHSWTNACSQYQAVTDSLGTRGSGSGPGGEVTTLEDIMQNLSTK